MPQELKEGNMVQVYTCPLTERYYEGDAVLEKIIEQYEFPLGTLTHCKVRFTDTGLLATRFILAI